MQRFFSPSRGGFFSEDVHGARQIEAGDPPAYQANPDCLIPDDAIAVSEERWRELLAATAEGKTLSVADGAVVAIDPPATEGSAG